MSGSGEPLTTLDGQLEAVLSEVLSPWGLVTARRRLERLGLDPRLAEDLVGIVGLAICTTFRRRVEPYPDFSGETEALRRYANCVFAARVKDLYGKVRFRPPDYGYATRKGDATQGDGLDDVLVPNPGYRLVDQPLVANDVVAADDLRLDEFVTTSLVEADEWRARLARRLDRTTCEIAAAGLATVTCAEEPGLPLPADVPSPQGSQHGFWPLWAGLFYAGRDDCFAAPGSETATVRKRRSRAIERLAGFLLELVGSPDRDQVAP